MSNRRVNAQARRIRHYRSMGRKMASRAGQMVLRKNNGDLARSEGVRNWEHGPVVPGRHPSVLTLHRQATRPRRDYSTVAYEDMTRDELRAVAKAKGLSGYGHMNKAALIRAVRRG